MAAATNSDKFSKLPELAKPFLYEVNLSLCMKSFKFRGNEKIHLEVREGGDSFVEFWKFKPFFRSQNQLTF